MVKIVLDAGHGAGKAFNRGGLLFNEGDHFRKPIENWSKVKWAIITMVATTAISSFIALFSSFFQSN